MFSMILAGVFTLPLMVNLGLQWFAGSDAFVALPLGHMVVGVLLISTLPLIHGMALRHFRGEVAARLEHRAIKPAIFLFVLIVGARASLLGRRQGIAIGLECGLQKAVTAIFVAGTLAGESSMVIPGIIYALVMNISAAGVILVNREPARDFLLSR